MFPADKKSNYFILIFLIYSFISFFLFASYPIKNDNYFQNLKFYPYEYINNHKTIYKVGNYLYITYKSLSMRKPCKTVRKQGWPILFKICW